MLIFVKKAKITKLLLLCQEPNFQCEFAPREFSMTLQTGKRYKTLENLTMMQFYSTCNNLHFPKFFKVFENRPNHELSRKMW